MSKAEIIVSDYHKDIYRDELDISTYSAHYKNLDTKLADIFATWQLEINSLFNFMNDKSKSNGHFNADPSRDLIRVKDQINDLSQLLKDTQFSFEIDPYIKEKLAYTDSFLTSSGGSPIPEDYKKITLKKYDPIFFIKNETIVTQVDTNIKLKSIGEGAFALVSKFKDPTYGMFFAVKQLKKGVDAREISRFQEEFKILSALSSPYVLSVYRFDENDQRYVMEYCDTTLKKYIDKNNDKVNFYTRKRIALQFLYGMSYLHHKKVLHRDLSYHNILIKQYDSGVVLVKLSDFGLVKTEESEFTKSDTEMKGTIIDPALDSFKDYTVTNEIYSIGMILNYIFTGKKNFLLNKASEFHKIIQQCTNQDLSKRFKKVSEILEEIDQLTEADLLTF